MIRVYMHEQNDGHAMNQDIETIARQTSSNQL